MLLKINRLLFRTMASFCNDWRDTIFYSCLTAGLIANFVFSWKIPVGLFGVYAEIREIARAIAWLRWPDRNIRYSMMGVFVCACLQLERRFVFAITSHALPITHTVNAGYSLLFLGMAAVSLSGSGGLKNILKSYQETLFDYPRKIKPPPKPKKNGAKESIKNLLDRLKNGLGRPLPTPT
jgi:hypothetical protein